MMTLRSFCCRSLAGLAVFAFSPLAVARDLTRQRHRSLATLNFDTFATELGSSFDIDNGERGVRTLRLIRADRKKPLRRDTPNAPDSAYEKFSLVFADTHSQRLEQDCYAFTHPRLGRFELFIVPVGSLDPAVHKYEAVFNRPPLV